MDIDQLEHAIRAACDASGDDEIWIFGSQAILGEYPDAPVELRRSMELDVSPRNRPEAAERIEGALGELSPFHVEYGFYVHGLRIEEAATLPAGWKERAIPVLDEIGTRGNTGWCLEAHDLAVSRIAAFRDTDREFVRLLLSNGLVDFEMLRERLRPLDIDPSLSSRLLEWLDRTRAELD